MDYFATSEAVTEGHPDKICDQISDAILDAYLEQDRLAHVAVETFVSGNTLHIAGEVTANATVDVTTIARNVIRRIGYVDKKLGFTADNCLILTDIHVQSEDIKQGVSLAEEDTVLGSGDQGIMYGYATDETENYMPLTVNLAQGLVRCLDTARHTTELGRILRPDGKAQVTIRYDENGRPIDLKSVIVSTQHVEKISTEKLREIIMACVIKPVCGKWLTDSTAIHINPTGRFVIGGPVGDTGLTGRKIMVDTYGTIARHGGGAFSGKDATKVDRSGAYMARYVAKNIVAAKLARRAEVAISYSIGSIYPEAVQIETFGTNTVPMEVIAKAVEENFSFAVADFVRDLELRKPQFARTAVYGHFGRENEGFGWEKLDKVQNLNVFTKM